MTKMGQKWIKFVTVFLQGFIQALFRGSPKVWISPCRTDGQKTLYWTENRAHDSSESVKRVIPKELAGSQGGARARAP